jgi:ABC-type multidrug transport system fused ATPase/permease subunit
MTQPMSLLLRRLWRHISLRRRGQFALILVLMILATFAEILSIGAILPFIAILTDPDRVFVHPSAQTIIQALELTDSKQLLLPLTIAFGLAALIAGAMRLLLLWGSTRLSYAAGAELSINIYHRTLYQPYAIHIARNSSEVINGISSKGKSVINIINAGLNLITSSITLTAILTALLAINPIIGISTFGCLGMMYVFVVRITSRRLLFNSQRISRESNQVIKCLQEGLGGIRDVLIDGSQATYCRIYSKADLALRDATGNNAFVGASPRYALEALGMVLIAALAYSLARQSDGIANAVPVLGVLALSAQRLLPAIQQAFASWANIRGAQASLQDTLDLLDQPLPDYADQSPAKQMPFREQISLTQLSFRYNSHTPWVLNNLCLTITKGSRVGFIGVTGSGKSTLLDIIMGLLHPTKGTIEIDGQAIRPGNYRAWQAHIAHVPQAIFLADTTIEENIAFGVPKTKIDQIRVRQAAHQAQISDTIEAFPKQYQTFVGERGIRLSGGQRQRIGIARALYKQADVIIFDEATSALDNETEQAVMQAIEGLSSNLTILIIAHRLTTLKNCTQIVELGGGGIKRIGTYQDIVFDVR